MQLFFVISGFLITYLLLKESQLTGRINIPKFYLRRVLRIWPLYYLVMIMGILVLPYLGYAFQFCSNVFLNLTFLNNFDVIREINNSTCYSPNVGIAWSVAIEEQFYLLWPLLLWVGRKNIKWLLIFLSVLFICSGGFNFLYPKIGYFHTIGNMGFLIVGCWAAFIFQYQLGKIKYQWWMSSLGLLLTSISVGTLLIFNIPGKEWIVPIGYMLIILILAGRNKPKSKVGPIAKLGKYTYGMYLLHPTVIMAARIPLDLMGVDYQNSTSGGLVCAILALVLTIGLSIVSYHLVEMPFLRLKDRLAIVKTRL